KKQTRYPISPESRVVFLTAGGGGWGDPLERDPEAVAADVSEGYISPEKAADYGVVLDPASGEVNLKATEMLRVRMQRERQSQQ
ncbi:MAG: hydantoinase B/oxoprolinase family protein, partial [Deltaproteobacteria bacterium]|nr:hydantoinase B/oxoprolinase family protein [Deltaproteobacteria bacterium]